MVVCRYVYLGDGCQSSDTVYSGVGESIASKIFNDNFT